MMDSSVASPVRTLPAVRARPPRRAAAVGGRPDDRSFAEVVDCLRASVTFQGNLTDQGADLITGTVEALRRSGHTRITVDLRGVRYFERDALESLQTLCAELESQHIRLILLSERS